MKKMILTALLILAVASALAAAGKEPAEDQENAPAPVRKKIFMQVGAVEKVENDKYVMRKTETRYEFYLDEKTAVFLRTESSASDIQEGGYIVVKGPKNRNVVLANSVYIYSNKEEYEKFMGNKEDSKDEMKKVFSAFLEGYVRQKNPLMIRLNDSTDYTVAYDEDTYWILTKFADKSEIKAGERIKLFFDKFYSIRTKNYPIKVVIDRVKSGF